MRKSHVHWPITIWFSFILLVGLLFKGPLAPLPAQAADQSLIEESMKGVH